MQGLKEFKQLIGTPLILSHYVVKFNDLDPTGRLAKQVYQVDLNLAINGIKTYKMRSRVVPYYVGMKKTEEPIAFKVSFTESKDGYISKFFNSYFGKFNLDNGTIDIATLNKLLCKITVIQLDNNNDERIYHHYKECFFVESSSFTLKHSTIQEYAILTFDVYARSYKRATKASELQEEFINVKID